MSRRSIGWAATTLALLGFGLRSFLSATDVPVYRDLAFFVLPLKHFLWANYQAGQLPVWNPWIYGGTPFLASLQTGVLYPPSIAFLASPFPLAFNLFVLTHFAAAGCGVWWWLADRGNTPAARALATVAFCLGGYLVSMVNVTNHLQTAVWAPWVLLFVRRAGRRPTPGVFLALAVALALQILGGAPEVLLLTLCLALASLAAERRRQRWARTRALAVIAGAGVAAAGFCAFQILPTLESIALSPRASAMPFAAVARWSLEPVSLLHLLLPRSHGLGGTGVLAGASFENVLPWIRSPYLGLATLALGLGGALAARGRRDRRVWVMVVVVGTVLALGDHTPIFALLYDLAPTIVGKFRFPEKFYFVLALAAVALAADGVDRAMCGDRRALGASLAALGSFAALGVLCSVAVVVMPSASLHAFALLKGRPEEALQFAPLLPALQLGALRLMMVAGALAVAILLCLRGRIGRSTAAAGIVLLTGLELGFVHHDLNGSMPWSRLAQAPRELPLDALRARGTRVFHYDTRFAPSGKDAPEPVPGLAEWQYRFREAESFEALASRLWSLGLRNSLVGEGVRSFSAWDGIRAADQHRLAAWLRGVPQADALRALRSLGYELLLGPGTLDDEPPRAASDVAEIAHGRFLREAAPRVSLASRLRVDAEPESTFTLLGSEAFRAGRDAVVEALPTGWTDRHGVDPGRARIAIDRPTEIRIEVDAAVPSLLVLRDRWFPGWVARSNGREIDILRVDGLYRGVPVGAGRQLVEFRYEPASIRVGAFGSAAAWALTLGGVWAWRRRQ